jgi:hypothetical protein
MKIATSDSFSHEIARNRALTGLLECVIASLELSADQRSSIESTYQECGLHLSRALGYEQHLGDIFPQGSMRLGTVIRPYRDITEVFDLDVVFRLALPSHLHAAEPYCASVGKHLKSKYNGIVKPLPKGWRLDYSDSRNYYLDIIPAMDSPLGGQVIAITNGSSWNDSHPRGYAADFFEPIAAILPRFEKIAMLEEGAVTANSARIEPLPEHTHFKLPLQRITQISKRHRDYYFNKKTRTPKVATPSIVLTTLLALSYRKLVRERTFDSGFDVLFACVQEMPSHIKLRQNAFGAREWWLPNPSLPSENLIHKWKDPSHKDGFYNWHRDYVVFLQQLQQGGASPRNLLTEAFGARAVNSAFAKQAQTITGARLLGKLSTEPKLGLTLAAAGNVSSSHLPHGL